MQLNRKQGSTPLRSILFLTLLSFLAAGEALAFQRSVSRTGPNGHTASRSATTNRTDNGYTRNVTATGPQGNTATRSAQGQWDPGTQTWSRSATSTGPNGGTASKDVNVTRTENGYSRNATVTGPQGNSHTRSSEGQWDPTTNTWTKSVTTTGAGQ